MVSIICTLASVLLITWYLTIFGYMLFQHHHAKWYNDNLKQINYELYTHSYKTHLENYKFLCITYLGVELIKVQDDKEIVVSKVLSRYEFKRVIKRMCTEPYLTVLDELESEYNKKEPKPVEVIKFKES